MVAANHPYGAVEGLALISLLNSVRSDLRVLANSILHRIPQLHDQLIFVDPFSTSDSARANIRGVRQAIEWVRQGGEYPVRPDTHPWSDAYPESIHIIRIHPVRNDTLESLLW